MSDHAQQVRFSKMVALLIMFAFERGYEVTGGDWYRDKRCPYGSDNSFHHRRLALDLNLFKDGEYLEDTEDYAELGNFWQSIGGTWGGKWLDGNHFSLGEG